MLHSPVSPSVQPAQGTPAPASIEGPASFGSQSVNGLGASGPAREEGPAGPPDSVPGILIVDDETDLCAILATALRRRGYRAAAVADGAQALRCLQTMPIHLVISDVSMPGVDGLELLNRLRAQRPDLPVIAMSGGMNGLFRGSLGGDPLFLLRTAQSLGARCTLPKPFAIEDLLQAVRHFVGAPSRPEGGSTFR
jgi:CheY-like chemotaxis protein